MKNERLNVMYPSPPRFGTSFWVKNVEQKSHPKDGDEDNNDDDSRSKGV